MVKGKSVNGTLLSFRVSYAVKNKLMKVVEELRSQPDFPNANLTDAIKIAIEHTWGICCYDKDTTKNG